MGMSNVFEMLPRLEPSPQAEAQIARLSTAQLKAMWDREEYAHFCDEIYFEMQRRGEGRYVAV